jgi:hypothetical protein
MELRSGRLLRRSEAVKGGRSAEDEGAGPEDGWECRSRALLGRESAPPGERSPLLELLPMAGGRDYWSSRATARTTRAIAVDILVVVVVVVVVEQVMRKLRVRDDVGGRSPKWKERRVGGEMPSFAGWWGG